MLPVQGSGDGSGVWLAVALDLAAGVQGANGEHSCEESAPGLDADGRVSAVKGRGRADETTDETHAMLTHASVEGPSLHAVAESSPSCDP